MKNLPYIRYIIYGIVFLLMYLLEAILYPFIYPFRTSIRRKKLLPFWWFINDDEADEISNDYGDAGWRERKGINLETMNWLQKFIVSYRWVAIRNSHYNFKLHVLIPKVGTPVKINVIVKEGMATGMTYRNYWIKGKQYATYEVRGEKYFRYSFTKFILWGKVITIKKYLFFGKVVRKGKIEQNIQLGTSDIRYIYKHRIRLI